MADANGFILHPLTGDGSPATEYPASDYRIAINSLQSVPDGTPFGGISGIRAGAPSPLVKCDGTTAVVSAHAGWIQAWGRMYSYAVTTDHMLHIPTSTGSYKIALVVSDKAAGHGDSEGMSIQALPATTPDAQISGMVIARVDAGVASDTALTIQPNMLITAPSKGALDTVTGIDDQRAKLADGTEYTLKDGVWKPLTRAPVILGKQRENGMTSSAGAYGVRYTSPDGTAPDVLVVSNGPYVEGYEEYGKDYQLMRWGDAGPDGFQIRVARGGQWASSVPVFFSWMAVWLHPGVKS